MMFGRQLLVSVSVAVVLVLLTTSISALRLDLVNRRITGTRAKVDLSTEQQIETELDEALTSLDSLESETNANAETETETETETESEVQVDSQVDSEAGKKRYEGIEHMYAGIGLHDKKQGTGASRWLDSNGIGGTIKFPKEDSNSMISAELADLRQVATEPLYNEGAEKPDTAKADQFIRWTYPELVPIFGDYYGPTSKSEIICQKGTDEDQINQFVSLFSPLWKAKHDTDASGTVAGWVGASNGQYIQGLRDEILEREHQQVQRSHLANQNDVNNKKIYGSKALFKHEYEKDKDNKPEWNAHPHLKKLKAEHGTLLTAPKQFKYEGDLLKQNNDHFVENGCAQRAYSAGHTAALRRAFKGGYLWALAVELDKQTEKHKTKLQQSKFKDSQSNYYDVAKIQVKQDKPQARSFLRKAYAMDGAAAHFLTDSFSSGHIRAPRQQLHEQCGNWEISAGWMSNVMHDEDNLNGVLVQNEHKDIWWAFGDKRFFDDVNAMNRAQIARAVTASRDEIWDGFMRGVGAGIKWLNENSLLTMTPLKKDMTIEQALVKIATQSYRVEEGLEKINIYSKANAQFNAVKIMPKEAVTDPRMSLENTCPKYRLKDGQWQIRLGTADAGKNVRPQLAVELQLPSTHPAGNAQFASNVLLPEFRSLKPDDFKIPKSAVEGLAGKELEFDCQYEPLTQKHCCDSVGGVTEEANRFKPVLHEQGFKVPTYFGQCKNVSPALGWSRLLHPFSGGLIWDTHHPSEPKKTADLSPAEKKQAATWLTEKGWTLQGNEYKKAQNAFYY